jgi:galactokinase
VTLRRYRVPGRIEFLGKHTDYAGGRSLICATEQGFSVRATERIDPVLRIVDQAGGESAELPLRSDLEIPAGSWAAYPATVARRLARDFGPLTVGLDLSFTSDLPRDAGLSSSSALVVAVAVAVADANRLPKQPAWLAALPDRDALAGYLGAVENGLGFGPFEPDGGVGTRGGSQDHTAILCSEPGMLLQYGFDPVRFERAVPFPARHQLVVAVSGVVAAKTGAAMALYNRLAESAAELLRVWRNRSGREDPTLFAALSSSPDARPMLEAWLDGHPGREALIARLDQFAAECQDIIPAVGDLLERGEVSGLGELVDRSQQGAERGLANQVPETVHLQRSARRLGAVAASAFGAGFGGSVWALAPEERAAEFAASWEEDYLVTFPEQRGRAQFIRTAAGGPARTAVERSG